MTTPSCPSTDGCPNGTISFEVVPFPSGGFPPAPYDPGYSVQPCDTVTWDFGDGSTQTIAGDPAVAHAYPTPGNYVIGVTVANARGSATAEVERVIATCGASQVEVFVTARSAGTAAISASARDRKTRPATITVNPAKETRRRSARH